MRAAALACLLGSATALGCALDFGPTARTRAEGDLRCAAPALRVRAAGHLVLGQAHKSEIELYEASGCEKEQLYVCSRGMRRCEREPQNVVLHSELPAFERAEAVLRQAARARCPESELRVIQESETLFRFESCDGAWLYHCRARRCERLPSR